MLEDKDLLLNVDKQKVFMTRMTTNAVGQLCSELSSLCSAMRVAKGAGVDLPKQPNLGPARAAGKQFCGVHAVMSSIQPSQLPKNSEELPAYVTGLEQRLKKKGIGSGNGMVALPKHFQTLLEGMKAAKAESKPVDKSVDSKSK